MQKCFVKDVKMLYEECKNAETGAFSPQFCINIQNNRKIANKALFFHNAQNYS